MMPAGPGAWGDGEPRVPTAIAVTSADMALPPQDERTLPAVVLRDVDRRPLEQALAEMQALVEHHGHVIVVCSQAAPTAVRDWSTPGGAGARPGRP